MARKREQPAVDPGTGKPLPDGVQVRPSGGYQARKLVSGKRQSKTFQTAKAAERWLMETAVDHARGVFVDRSLADKTTIGALLKRYRMEVTPAKKGATQEAGHLLVLERAPIATVRLGKLTRAEITKFRDDMLAADYAGATVVRRMNLLQHIIKHAMSEWGIQLPANPMQGVNRPRGADKKRNRGFRDADEAAKVVGACDADANRWLGPAVRWALATAMRQGEIVSLSRKHDLRGEVCRVRGLSGEGSKNDEIREVPLFEDALAVLKTLPKGVGDRLFPIDQNILKMRFRRAMKGAGVDDLTFHDLRHIATGRLRLRYPNPLDLAKVTGHRDLKSLQRYYNVTGEELLKLALPLPAAPLARTSSGALGGGDQAQEPAPAQPAPPSGALSPP